jgi:hypothetical protein
MRTAPMRVDAPPAARPCRRRAAATARAPKAASIIATTSARIAPA